MHLTKRSGVLLLAMTLGACSEPAAPEEVDTALAELGTVLASCPLVDATPSLPQSAGSLHTLTDPVYSPTCDVQRQIDTTLENLRRKYPNGVLIVLDDPRVIVIGTKPARTLEVRINIVLVKNLPVDDGQGGLKEDVEIVIADFDAWASSQGFEKEQIDNIRLKLQNGGVAVSGDYKFEAVKNAQATSTVLVVKVVFEKGTSYPTAKEHVDDWVKEGKKDPKVIIERK